ncbi:MAG: C1 family peptidase [Sediminibacterium sp.]
MKKYVPVSLIILFISMVFSSCQKEIDSKSLNNELNTSLTQNNNTSYAVNSHTYGLIPMKAEQWEDVPNFTPDIFKSSIKSFGLNSPSVLASSYLLYTPTVRDQKQIGSCTGFCGAETNEILNYYKNGLNTSVSSGLYTSTGLTTASSTNFSPTSTSAPYLSPLFIYYVERCIINKQKITVDNGAYMVNIGQALQGLTNNTGTGVALSGIIANKTYTFKGDCTESSYSYPTTGTNTSSQYITAPNATAISEAGKYGISAQIGTTSSTGTTTTGYFVINSIDPVKDVKTAIYNKKPVMMGFNVYDNKSYQIFEGLGVNGYAPSNYTYNPLNANGTLKTGLTLLGGHAVPIVGYIDDANQPGGGLFICQNSWSTNWGNKGYFYLPYSVLKSTSIVAPGSLYVAII